MKTVDESPGSVGGAPPADVAGNIVNTDVNNANTNSRRVYLPVIIE